MNYLTSHIFQEVPNLKSIVRSTPLLFSCEKSRGVDLSTLACEDVPVHFLSNNHPLETLI